MSFLKRRRQKILFLGGTIAGLIAVVGAVAYFTTTGSGTGSATVGTNSALTIHATSASTLYPGTSSAVSFTVDNPPSAGHQQLGTVTLTAVHACTGTGSSWNGTSCSNSGTEQTSCESFDTNSSSTTDNFSMSPVVSNQDFGPGNGQSVTAGGTLTMNDLNSSQDSCKNANLTLSFSS